MQRTIAKKISYVKMLRARNFPLSLRDFGRIVGLTASRLRTIYLEDPERFYSLLDDAVSKWVSICKTKGAKK